MKSRKVEWVVQSWFHRKWCDYIVNLKQGSAVYNLRLLSKRWPSLKLRLIRRVTTITETVVKGTK